MTTHQITVQDAIALIQMTNGSFFSVTFEKRTTGELRSMTCRTGVQAYANGRGMNYDLAEKGLCGVWVANEGKTGAEAYRSFGFETIRSLRVGGQSYVVH